MIPHTPIGVFDSGFGGLSVLKSMIKLMPDCPFVYLADIAYAPYGEQSDTYIIERSQQIAHFMHDELKTQGLVIACNTATAAAGHVLRRKYKDSWPIIGTEPGIKPASSYSSRVAVMATRSTLQSDKFHALASALQQQSAKPLHFFLQPCDGLAKAIDERDENMIDQLIQHYTKAVEASSSEVVVLGCTHYALVADKIQQALPHVRVLDTGGAIARRVQSLFPQLRQENGQALTDTPRLRAWTSGSTQQLSTIIQHWMPEIQANIFFWNNGK